MDKKKAVYVPTVGEEIGNAVSHGVMSLLSLLALPFAAVWAYAHDPGGVLASVSVSVFVISIFLMFLASTLYHSMNPQSKHKEVFHILDHISSTSPSRAAIRPSRCRSSAAGRGCSSPSCNGRW